MERLLSDGGTNLVGNVIKSLTSILGVGRMQTYPLHPQANGTVERWNRTLARDLASFMATGDADWDEHIALACFRYNTGVCAATGMTPYKAVFGVDAFEAWGEVDRACFDDEPDSLAERLSLLHKELLSKAGVSRKRAKAQYDKRLNPEIYEEGDRVLLWSVKLNKEEGKKIVKPWIGPYKVTGKLGRVGYELKSEVGDKKVRVHANRLRKIPEGVVETGDPEDGMFTDSLRTLGRIAGTQVRKNKNNGQMERHFKVRISGSRAPSWTPESDLPTAVVKLYDSLTRTETVRRSFQSTEADGEQNPGSDMDGEEQP